MQWLAGIGMAILGAALGSFACCNAIRLALPKTKATKIGKRSVCLYCYKQLKWYDNIPLISWLSLRGKCRYCGARIGKLEIIAEIIGALSLGSLGYKFYTSAELTILPSLIYLSLITMLTIFAITAILDAQTGRMPEWLLWLLIGGAGVYRLLIIFTPADQIAQFNLITPNPLWQIAYGQFYNLVLAMTILAGIYLALSVGSKERLVGSGDWYVGLAMALVLGDAWLALNALLLSNLIGSTVCLPRMVKKKLKSVRMVPFLFTGFVITLLFTPELMQLLLQGLPW